MKFLLDENFPKAAVELLAHHGHECYDLSATDLEGADDVAIVQEAQQLRAIILSTDRDFYHTLRHQLSEHCGVVVVALKQPNRVAILARLEWLLENVPEEALAGRAFQLRDKTWVAQPPLETTG